MNRLLITELKAEIAENLGEIRNETHIVRSLVAIGQSVDHLLHLDVVTDRAQVLNRRINTFGRIANDVLLRRFD